MVVVAALVVTAVIAFRWGAAGPGDRVAGRPTPSPTPTGPLTVAEVYETLLPSVVSIQARRDGPATAWPPAPA